jgi:deazaflavin-dependent oxidoreductase (nitroreductase family)
VDTPNRPADRQPTIGGTARTLALQGLANRVVRGLLRTPLLCRVVGARLITLYVVGRKSGRRYSVPVAYLRHDGALLIGSPFAWVRNLRTGKPVEVRLRGRRLRADVQVFTDEAAVVELYGVMAGANRQFAKFNGITLDADGVPSAADLRSAWVAGARAVRLVPRPVSRR